MLHSQLVEPSVNLIVVLKRQRRWAVLFATGGILAVIALARYFNPHPLPLSYVASYTLLALVVIAGIIEMASRQTLRIATELETTNASLHAEIADRMRMENELRESEQRYRELFENAEDLIAIMTVDGVVTAVNRGAEVLLGLKREEAIGRHFRDFLTPAANARMEERFRRFYAGEKVSSVFDLELVRKDGSVVPVEVRARFIRDGEGNLIGIQTIHRDMSVRKALEEQRADFLAMLTHDIRTPLQVILGYSELLLDEAQAHNRTWEADVLLRLRSSTLTVSSLVANYLDFSKIEKGRLELTTRPLALNHILRQIKEQYEAEARRRRVTLHLQLQEDLSTIHGDPLALERVFANLLQNALKFTPEAGQVTVRSAQDDGEVIAAIADSGPGIAPEELPLLFEKYRRTEEGKKREGTGLGLFIVKSLVEAHGGRVEVESIVGVGSCFRVFLPTAPVSIH
jgi:PAS domain S-box-containing protein